MSTEKLTQKALEQHDKIHPKLQSTKVRASSQSKDERTSIKGRTRHVSRSESNKSLLNGYHPHHEGGGGGPNQNPLERQASKASLPIGGQHRAGMSVFRVVAAARAWKKLSQRKPLVPEKPKVRMENTYRLGPEPEHTFKPDKVKAVIKDVLSGFLRNFKYTPEGSKQMCLTISSEIKHRVKRMNFPRYKIVCNVIIMQNKGQGSQVSSRSVWNVATDSYASHTFSTSQVVCVGNVHAIYFE
ncbi:tctex1 domain-containing protein 1-B [Aplysia californica]|uniref:Tctex1 domain-containing protein 1-B n=1 Tax=Aplysia californica TaxID=6500 RepID=A0ABM0JGL8_APLCA|nr:tctex1 domain-containing protein 1-B [Aplysia californica]